jgi:flavorubredoxin
MPEDVRGFQPLNSYLVIDDAGCVLVDTGVAAHEATVLSQLEELLPPGQTLSIFLTRPEFDCFGNVIAICSRFHVDTVYAGGISNPFDAFDYVASTHDARGRNVIDVKRRPPGEALRLSGGRQLRVLSPALRILPTFWVYDTETQALFTSDSFGHTILSDRDALPVLAEQPQPPDPSEICRRTYAKFGWLARARPNAMTAALERVFADNDVKVIAPTHGCILRGPALDVHREMFLHVLSRGAA